MIYTPQVPFEPHGSPRRLHVHITVVADKVRWKSAKGGRALAACRSPHRVADEWWQIAASTPYLRQLADTPASTISEVRWGLVHLVLYSTTAWSLVTSHIMHILVTGAAGLIGGRIMIALLQQGHQVTATDINPIPAATEAEIQGYIDNLVFVAGDLTDFKLVDRLFESGTIDGVAHIGGIRSPLGLDPRFVHNLNVTASYNVLQTAAAKGVTRIVQASSCNALGLSWTQPEHWQLDFVPINETHPMRPVSVPTVWDALTSRKTPIACLSCK